MSNKQTFKAKKYDWCAKVQFVLCTFNQLQNTKRQIQLYKLGWFIFLISPQMRNSVYVAVYMPNIKSIFTKESHFIPKLLKATQGESHANFAD